MSLHATTPTDALRLRYEAALASFVARVKQDRYIVAAILYGSLAYDDVWEKSDIDISLFGRDDKTSSRFYVLVEDGINFHVELEPRSKAKSIIEQALHGTFTHSLLTKSVLLFSTDETIQEYYRNVQHVGSRDREMQMLNLAAFLLPRLTKAEKWLVVKKDPTYSFLWIMGLLNELAAIEVLWHSDVPSREAIQQALIYNPAFFTPLYTDFVHQPKDTMTVQRALDMIHAYLDEKIPVLFRPILSYLSEAGGPRSSSELDEHFHNLTQAHTLIFAYEWLADKGIIRKVSAPLRLTEKSRVTLDEAAYYYDGGDFHDAD